MLNQVMSSRPCGPTLSIRAVLAAAMFATVPIAVGPLAGCATRRSQQPNISPDETNSDVPSGPKFEKGNAALATTQQNRRGHDNDRAGEWVEVRVLTRDDLKKMFEGEKSSRQKAFVTAREGVFPDSDNPRSTQAAVALALPLILGLAVDAVVAELRERANEYEAQYEGVLYGDDFTTGGGVTYAAIEIRRWTNRYPRSDGNSQPAMRAVFAIKTAAHDASIMTLQPLFMQVASSKAKSAQGDISLNVSIEVDGAWFGVDRAWNARQLARAEWTFPNTQTTSNPKETSNGFWAPEHNRPVIAGWFPVPPRSIGVSDGAAFRIRILVTERDESKAKQYIEHTADILESNRNNFAR